MGKPSLSFFIICAVVFASFISWFFVTDHIMNDKGEVIHYAGLHSNLSPAEDELLLQNGNNAANIVVSPELQQYDGYDEILNNMDSGLFFPEYVNEIFYSDSDKRLYTNINFFYLTEANVNLENPIATESNDMGEYCLYKAASDYSQNIFLSAISLQYHPEAASNTNIRIAMNNSYDKFGFFKKYMQQYTDMKISSMYYASSEIIKVDSPLFDESYIVSYTCPGDSYPYYKFVGLKNLETPISFLDFSNNKTAVTQENLSGFVNKYTEHIFIIECFQEQNMNETTYKLTLEELQKMIDSITIK